MNITIVSPHDDDAIWSLGEYIATWVEDGHDITILTVFGGMPEDNKGKTKHSLMQWEHFRACASLGVRRNRLGFLDSVYEPRPQIEDILRELKLRLPLYDVVVGPRGIHHPDHKLVERALYTYRDTLNLAPVEQRWLIYDEIPYYVEYPEQVSTQRWPADMPRRENLLQKKLACSFYKSQIDEYVERMLWVPERLWQA